MLVFEERGKNRSTPRKTSRSKEKNQQQTLTHIKYGVDAKNWTRAMHIHWEASALTSSPPLPPIFYLIKTRLPDSNFSQDGIYVNWMPRFTKIKDSHNFFLMSAISSLM